MSVTTCLLTHLSAKSPIAAYRKDMADDVAELVADGMTTEAAWLKVAGDKLTELKAERERIEQVVAEAYAKTAAGKPADAVPADAATHKDPGEPAEVVTPAVVAEAIKTAATNEGRSRSEMKADALRLIDAAIAKAPSTSAADDSIGIREPITERGKKVIKAVRTFGDESISVEAREGSDGKWEVVDKSFDGSGTGRYKNTRLGGLVGTPAIASRQLRDILMRLQPDGTMADSDFTTIKIPGDGTFKVVNTKERLAALRRVVESSPGFRETRRPAVERVSDTLDRRSPLSSIKEWIDEGDAQAAVDYAADRGLDLAEALKGDKLRLSKVAGLTPTTEDGPVADFEPEPAPAPATEAPTPTAASPAPASPAEPQDADGIASQTFDQWARSQYASNEYKASYLDEFGGNENRATLGSIVGTIDNDRTTAELLKAAKQKYASELLGLPRETRISLDVYDALTPEMQREAQRHFFDLDIRITRRTQDEYGAKAKSEASKKTPYEAALAEVSAEIKRLDAISGPETQKQRNLSARRERLKEAIFQIGQGKEPDGRLLRAEPAQPVAQAEPAKAATPGTVENFGEALPPGRRQRGTSLDNTLTDDDIAKKPLSDIWPLAENEAIEDTFAAAVAHAARAEVPPKPRVAYKLKRWVEAVKTVRSLAQMIVSGNATREQLREKAPKSYAMEGFWSKVALLEAIDRSQWKRIGEVRESPQAFKYEDGKKVDSPQVAVSIDGKNHWMEGSGSIADHIDAINKLLGVEPQDKKMAFEVRGRGNAWFINKKGDSEYRQLKTFTTSKEALEYRSANYAELVKAWDEVKNRDNVTERDLRSDENKDRVGKDWRNGKDISGEDFDQTFGFRGGEFGKWVSQGKGDKERQWMLNRAYDALMDLAEIVGVPPKAISLNGTLGIAFGSRGTGWASAHFEPGNLVINLTKTRGAGALAHEWFHALDNYFSRARGGEVPFNGNQGEYRRNNYVTYKPEPLMVRKDGSRHFPPMTKGKLAAMHERRKDQTDNYNPDKWMPDPAHKAGVRPEVEERFSDLVTALNEAPMTKRAELIDKGTGYWSQIIERAARSFEAYVIERMREKGQSNDYLANVTPIEAFQRDRGRYPYPTPDEIKPVADAFDALFDTVQTREEDGKTVMFSIADTDNQGAKDGSGKDFWKRLGELRRNLVAERLPLETFGHAGRRVGRYAGSRPASIATGLEQVIFDDKIGGFEELISFASTFTLKDGRTVFRMYVMPMELVNEATIEQLKSTTYREQASVLKITLDGTKESGFSLTVEAPSPGDIAHDRATPGSFEPTGQRDYKGDEYYKGTLGLSASNDYLSEAARRFALHYGYAPEVTVKRDTGANPGRPARVFKPSEIEAKFSIADQPFYSELSRLAEKVPMNAAPAAGWKMWLKGLPAKGVKADEIAWTGIEEWLDMQPGKVTKQQVLDFLNANGVKVTETVLGAPTGRDTYQERMQGMSADELQAEADENDVDTEGLGRDEIIKAILDSYEQDMGSAMSREVDQAKYGQYQLPGGTNYREVLLTLPQPGRMALREKAIKARAALVDVLKDPNASESDKAQIRSKYDAIAAQLDARPPYKSSHWDQANVLAHIRLNDRTDADGKRVLFVEEIQSDWGQAAKKKGFGEPNGPRGWGDTAGGTSGGVPRAPFVDKTDKWVALALKRVVKMAVDGGYDKVAFVTGEQSADRYSLSRAVDMIGWTSRPTGAKFVSMALKNGGPGTLIVDENGSITAARGSLPTTAWIGKKLDEVIGKDMADRIMRDDTGELQDEGLKVGGEGMRAFYDKIVPSVLKDVLRKVGGGQVESVEINRRNFEEERNEILQQPGFTITPAMREKAAGGLPLFDATGLDRRYAASDTSAYEPAGNADTAAVERIAASLNRGRSRSNRVVLDAVAPRAGSTGERGRTLTATAAVAKRLFGHRVVFVKFQGAELFNGAVDQSQPGVIFINADTQRPMLAVLGHELLHRLRAESPDIYNGFVNRIERVIKDFPAYFADIEGRYKKHGLEAPSNVPEELHGDIVGDFFTDPQFWKDLSEGQPNLFKRLANAILKFLDDVVESLAGMRSLESKRYLTDINAARSAVVGAMREFSGRQVAAADNASEGIRLSITDTLQEHVDRVRGLNQQKVRDAFADMVGSAGSKVSWWDKHLGTQYAKAEKFPAYKRVFERVQSYIEDTSTLANEAADQAPMILPKLETWKDLRKSFQQFGLKKADAEAVAAPIFQGTLTDQKVYSDEELRTDFNLNPEQIKAYRQFRNAVNTSLDQVVASDVLRLLGDKNPALRELALADRDSMRSGIDAYLTQQIEQAEPGDEKASLLVLRTDIRDKYEKIDKLKAEGYAPLMRFGQYKVYVSDPETGESLFFGLYESKGEANRMARDLAEDPQFAGKTIEQGVLSQEQYKLFNSVPVESLEMFADAIGAEKSEVFQAYLRLAKNNRSALKRLIHRKGTAGFSEDVPRVLASFITSNSRLASGAMNLTSAKTAIEDIRDGDVKDEAIQLVDSVQNPKETASAARGLMFANFIGGSIASAAVNLTQPVTMTLPYLSQFGGMAKATARLMSAAKMAASGKVDDPELQAALKKAEDDGTVSPQEIHHLTAQAMGSWGNNAVSKRAAFIWGAPFSLAEQFNRRTSFIAAYKTAQAEGIDDPFGFAEKAVTETQGLYNKGNMPNLSRGAIGATAMQFKQYSIHYLEWMKRMWNAGEAGSDQRRAGRRAVLIALALLMAAAGTDGLPFAEDIDDLIDTIGQALGYNTNSKKARRDLIANTLGLGDETADTVARGLSALPGVPMDVSLRMGMGNLLPGTGLFLRSNTDRSRDLLEFAGPAGGMAKQYMDAAQKGLSGDIGGAAAGLAPVAIQNAMKAMDMWQTGEARDTMGRKVMEADEVDGFMKFLGFNPSAIARESQKMGMIRRSEQLAKNVEGEIAGKWARAFADGDSDGVAAARAELADWNEANPEERIVITSSQILQRVKKLRQSRAQRFITSASPERRRSVEEAMQ